MVNHLHPTSLGALNPSHLLQNNSSQFDPSIFSNLASDFNEDDLDSDDVTELLTTPSPSNFSDEKDLEESNDEVDATISSTTSPSTSASSAISTISESQSRNQLLARVIAAAAAATAAVTPPPDNTSSLSRKRRLPTEANEQPNKKFRSDQDDHSVNLSPSPTDDVNNNCTTTSSSSSSSIGSILYRHDSEEDNQPKPEDYIAAGVNPNRTCEASMAHGKDRWEKIRYGNVKWHNNIAHAWVRRQFLDLACIALPKWLLEKLGIQGSVIVYQNSSPYIPIPLSLCVATSFTSSTRTLTNSQIGPLLASVPPDTAKSTLSITDAMISVSSSSSSIDSILDRHASEEDNIPRKDDFDAAGVHSDLTYDTMPSGDTAWKNIKITNIKWHENGAYAWTIFKAKYLRCRPLPQSVLKTLGIKGSVKQNKWYSPYPSILLNVKPSTSSTSSTSTSTSSRALPPLIHYL